MNELNTLKRKRIEHEVSQMDTEELQAVLSRFTVQRIEKGEPVRYKSALLYCKALGLDPYQTIIVERKISIIEEIV